jgi:ubiquinone/menaquinone biosynthesis C-methylase UbiE
VLDVGGGPGTYAAPLARHGYRVHVVDPVPLHIDQARQAAGAGPAAGFTAALGDARDLAGPGESQDAVLLFGPLYHLTAPADRQQALAEARRVLAPEGRPAERRELPPPGLDALDSPQVVRFFNNYWVAPADLPWARQTWSRG